jgi:hypothetical protein
MERLWRSLGRDVKSPARQRVQARLLPEQARSLCAILRATRGSPRSVAEWGILPQFGGALRCRDHGEATRRLLFALQAGCG